MAPDLAIRPEDHERLEASYSELLRRKRKGAPIVNSSRFLTHSLDYLKTGDFQRYKTILGSLGLRK